MSHILIIDDETDIKDIVSDILQDEGYTTHTASNSVETFQALDERLPDIVLLDVWLQGSELDGLGILEILRYKYPDTPVVMMSGHGNIETAVNAIKMGAYDYIEKPFKADRLLLVIQHALEHAKLKEENQSLRKKYFPHAIFIGKSSPVNQLRQTIDKVAPTSSRIMITGEAGTGKEAVARLIHQKSRRNEQHFVCFSATNRSTAQCHMELFGTAASHDSFVSHEKTRKIGAIERANGGTLFIDEVTHLPMDIQAKLLQFLQKSYFERTDSGKKITADVRIIASSHHNLKEAIAAGSLRSDLYDRLSVVPVMLPALSKRREDIPEIIAYFIKTTAAQYNLPRVDMTNEAFMAMQLYHWSGNIRQLRNVVEWILITTSDNNDNIITVDHLPLEITKGGSMHQDTCNTTTQTTPASNYSESITKPLREAREIFEKQYLEAQLERFGWNISKTANFVGMERSALHRKLKLLGITSSQETEAA